MGTSMRFGEACKYYYKYFGLANAFKLAVYPRVFSKIRHADLITPAILNFQLKDSWDVIQRYKSVTPVLDGEIPNIIWVCWWQGKDTMPEVIQNCYKSLLNSANGRKIILIDKDNYSEYANIPQFVIEKLRKGQISFSHFSDILRLSLLKEHGGLWVDSALFITRPIPIYGKFFMPRMRPYGGFCEGKWCFGLMNGPKNHIIFSYMLDCLLDYWSRHDAVVDYLMFDGLLRLGYENIESIHSVIDSLEISSPDLHSSRYTFSQEVDYNHLNELLANNNFLSLTWRIEYPKQTPTGAETYYGAILRVSDIH
jgi:hypothetical protein